MSRSLKLTSLVAVAVLVQACASTHARHEAVPAELTARAEIPGMPGVRYAAVGDLSGLVTIAVDSVRREQEYRTAQRTAVGADAQVRNRGSARRSAAEYASLKLGFIPPTFTTPHPEDFDQTCYGQATQGFQWMKAPPNFDPIG